MVARRVIIGYGDYECLTCGERHVSPRVWLTGAHERVTRCKGWYRIRQQVR